MMSRSLNARDGRGVCGGGGDGTELIPVVSPALKARDYKGPSSDGDGDGAPLIPVVAHALTAGGYDASEDGTGRGTPIVPSLRTNHHNNSDPTTECKSLVFQTRIARNGRGQPSEVCHTLTGSDGGTHADSKPHVTVPTGVRRLTPLECERVMGFPDGWTESGVSESGAVVKLSDAARYRALGNGVVPGVAECLATGIMEAIR